MKLEFPSDEGFVTGPLCHHSSFDLLMAANKLRLDSDETRNGRNPAILYTADALFFHPTVTSAIDAAIISIVREWIDDEHWCLECGWTNKRDELQKLLTDFLKSNRPHRTKKPAKQPTP